MTSPVIEQSSAVTAIAGVTSTTRALTGVTEGSSIVCGLVVNAGSTSPISSVSAQRTVSGSPVGSPVALAEDVGSNWLYEANKRIAFFRAVDLTAGDYTITATAATGSSSISMAISEISVDNPIQGLVTDVTQEVNGVTSITLGPAPGLGTIATDDALAFLVVSGTDGVGASYAVPTPSGWTLIGKNDDGSSGKQTFAMFYKTLSSDAAVTQAVTTGGTGTDYAATYGMTGAMAIYVPSAGPATTLKVKIVNKDTSPNGLTGISVDVFANPTTGETGSRIFTATGQTFDTIESGKSVMKITIPPTGTWEVTGLTLTAGDTVVVTGGATDSSHGFVRRAIGLVIEE